MSDAPAVERRRQLIREKVESTRRQAELSQLPKGHSPDEFLDKANAMLGQERREEDRQGQQ